MNSDEAERHRIETMTVTEAVDWMTALTDAAARHDADCPPDASYTGVSTIPIEDPMKLWRCDGCRAVGTTSTLNMGAGRRP